MTAPTIELRGVERRYAEATGYRRVLDGVDLVVEAGEVVAICGRSGSGKTTLLTLVAGLEGPDAGSVLVLGTPAHQTTRAWADVALLPQALGLLGELTIAENVGLPLRLGRSSGATAPAALLDRLGIAHLADRLPTEVSLGEQQRTALARAAISSPRLLLADEPLSHQNDAWAAEMAAVITELAAGGTTCLLATHDPKAHAAAHRVFELHDGRLAPAGGSRSGVPQHHP